jgi:hypothetical protein
MRKWFYPAQTVIEDYLKTNCKDWSSVRQTVTEDVVYEHYLCILHTGGQKMFLFAIHKRARLGQPGVISIFTDNGNDDHLQYIAPLEEPTKPVRERDTFNPDGI